MPAPKPVTLTYVGEEEYDGAYEPQPLVVVGDEPTPAEVAASDVSVEPSEGIVGDNVQAVLADLAARVVELEGDGG